MGKNELCTHNKITQKFALNGLPEVTMLIIENHWSRHTYKKKHFCCYSKCITAYYCIFLCRECFTMTVVFLLTVQLCMYKLEPDVSKSNWEKQIKKFYLICLCVLTKSCFVDGYNIFGCRNWKKERQKHVEQQNKTKSQTNHFENLKHLTWHAPASVFTTPLAPMRQFHLKSDVKAYSNKSFCTTLNTNPDQGSLKA